MTSRLSRIEVYKTVDKELPSYDYTKLSNYNVCPVWGIVRYFHHKRMPGAGRAMALEAGGVAHQCFAAVRIYQLYHHQHRHELAIRQLEACYGPSRAEHLRAYLVERDAQVFTLEVLYTAGYYDDPNDRRRTLANLEDLAIGYVARWDFNRYPVYVSDALVGVECSFDLTLNFIRDDGDSKRVRFTGRIDGIHVDPQNQNRVMIQENKTTWRIDDSWRMSYAISHQVTGYMTAARYLTGEDVSTGFVVGTAVPLPKQAANGFAWEYVTREPYQTKNWFDWFYHTVTQSDQYVSDPLSAPQYSHSCNRFFRPCSLIPLCASDHDEQQRILTEMEHDEWSPLEDPEAS